MRSEYPGASNINVTALAKLGVPRQVIDRSALIRRLKKVEKVPVCQAPKPAVIAVGVLLIVVTLDRNYRYPCILHKLETGDRIIHRFRRHISLVKKVTTYDHEIDPSIDPVTPQHIDPGIKEVPGTLLQLVSRAAKVYIGNVKEFHEWILPHSGHPFDLTVP